MKKFFTKRISLLLALSTLSLGAFATHSTHYSKATATANPTAAGSVYVSTSANTKGSSASATQDCGGSGSKDTHTYCFTAVTSAGYSFLGWFDGDNSTSSELQYNETVTASSTNRNNPTTITRTAKWKANTYTVTFDGNGGTPSQESKVVTFASTYGDLPSATRRFYTLDGWFTDKTDGSQVTPSTTVNTADDHTLHAHWTLTPEDQTLSWGAGMQFTMAKGSRQPIIVTASSELDAFTYESGNDEVIAIDGEYLVAVGNGEAEVTVRQAGNEFFNPAFLKATFIVSSKETPFFSENGFSADQTNELKVGDHVTLSVDKVSDGLDGDFTVTATTDNVIDFVREGGVITFTAAHAGSTSITVAQAETEDIYAASKTYEFNVTRYTPEFTLSANELVLDETATLTLKNTEAATIAFNPTGIVSFDVETGVITALVAGSTTLTVSQAETNSIEAKEETFEITVSKKTPSLAINMNGSPRTEWSVAQGSTVSVSFDKVSDADVEVTPQSGTKYASYVNGTMTAGAVGKAVYRATLPETETYKGTYKDFSLTVTASNTHLPITLNTQAKYNAVKGETSGTNSWDNSKGITLGGTGLSPAMNWDDKYVTIHFDGIPDKLSFQYAYDYATEYTKNTAVGVGQETDPNQTYFLFVEESADGASWTKLKWQDTEPTGTTKSSGDLSLKKATRYLRFHLHANLGAHYANITVTELKYVNTPEPNTIDMGTDVINAGEVSATSLVNWCNIAPLTVTSTNPRFTADVKSFGNFETFGSQQITIKYTHTNDVGENEGDITISNEDYTQTIHVKATTTKRQQTITWNAQLEATGFAMNVGESYPDETITAIATATSGGNIVFESDNEDAIIVTDGNILTAVGVGNATITATQAGDNEYDEVTTTQDFVVTLLQKQSIDWNQDQELYGLLTTSDPLELTANATSNGDIEYTSANTDIVRIEGNMLIVVGKGETYITATQNSWTDDNGITWLTISQDKYVIVRDPTEPCTEKALQPTSLTLGASKSEQDYPLTGIPETLTFTAKHGTKQGGWGTGASYAALVVEQYSCRNNLWDWYPAFSQVVTDSEVDYSAGLDESATRIRFATGETVVDHTITKIQVSRKRIMFADVEYINLQVENNAVWQQKIKVTHSNIDYMTISSEQGLINFDITTLGEGCKDVGDDEFIASFTPTVKNQEYNDVIIITDNKTDNPSTIEIPVTLYSKGLNQSITGFELPTTALTTDDIDVAATATSELEVSFESSAEEIAYVENGKLVILSDGEVTITATQEGNEKYDAAPSVEQTIVISKAPTTISTAPTAAAITYGQTLSESALTNGEASVEGEFAWEAPQTVPAAGTPTYSVVFTPTLSNIYATATTLVSVSVQKATPEVTTYPTAGDITIAQSVGESQLTGGEATVEGTFAWKNPEERRLSAGEYTRTVVFTPTDNNYNTVEISVSFIVINVLAKITELPVAVVENAIYGMSLADVELQGGSANVAGTFAWVDETTPLLAGTHNYAIVFTPEDLELYSPCNAEISITADKATPNIQTLPVAAGITYGATLAESELTDGATDVEGTFAWQDGSLLLAVGEHEAGIVFQPADADNYNTVEATATVLVGKAELQVIAQNAETVFGQDAPEFTVSYEGFVNGENAEVLGGVLGFECEYTVGDPFGEYDITPYGLTSDNYDITFVPGKLTVNKPAAQVTELPTATQITFGQTLADSELNGGLAETEGTFAWADPTVAPNAGTTEFPVIFTPDDTENFGATTVMVSLTVAKADAQIISEPRAVQPLGYTGDPLVLIVAGEAVGGTMVYSLDGQNFSEDLPTATAMGEYTVYFRVIGDANHNDAEGGSIIAAIVDPSEAKLTPEIIWEQELSNMTFEQSVQLEATCVSGVVYFELIVENDDIAYIDDDNVLWVYDIEGLVKVKAYVEETDDYYYNELIKEFYVVDPTTTSVDETAAQTKVVKIIRNDQLLIIRDGRTYNAAGLLVE